MEYTFSNNYWQNHNQTMLETMMGPNALRVSEELASFVDLQPGQRVLDLGCGMGLSTLLLARKYQAQICAADLWIAPTDNHRRFQQWGIAEQVLPLSLDATEELPFAEGYFDLIFSVDAYHYFGADAEMLPKLLPHLKPGGKIAIAVPGLREDFPDEIPAELLPFWEEGMNFFPVSWWRKLWQHLPGCRLLEARELDCHSQAWQEWLASPNPYAVDNREMMAVEDGKYFSHVMLIAERCE